MDRIRANPGRVCLGVAAFAVIREDWVEEKALHQKAASRYRTELWGPFPTSSVPGEWRSEAMFAIVGAQRHVWRSDEDDQGDLGSCVGWRDQLSM